ncbi:putative oxidoreductase [Nonomuraea muscovyensis]|uniref:Putative oxidoreductase n=1 Tax=Nonomuraea muscovyensis TaxID=1124761 RepID=A0A7X0EYJ3_9ACTN|nr:DoxX family protein [Nonomuraea muscovyensis]MBB6345741.1 putative oxidoreductase [Nonomuraea muscovyensis]
MKRFVFDVTALIARVTLGVILVAHGWQKWQSGLGATTQQFTQTGVPLPEVAAAFTIAAEVIGGILLIIGFLVRLAALAWFVVGLGAIAFVHAPNGMFVSDGGWEFAAGLAALCLMLIGAGGGRFGIDGIIHGAWSRKRERRRLDREGIPASGPGGVPPQGTAPQGTAPRGDMTREDMSDIDSMFTDDPTKRRPPNR